MCWILEKQLPVKLRVTAHSQFAPLQMSSLALGVGVFLIIALALAAVPVCFILISNANDAAAQRSLDINRRIFHVSGASIHGRGLPSIE